MTKLKYFLARSLRFLLPAACALALMTLVTEPALAAVEIGKWQAALEPISMILSAIIIIIVVLSLIFSLTLGSLMDSTFILDSGMGDTLHLIWEVMRNFVNVAFIIILLITAIFVIFKPGSEGGVGMLKKILPKFVLALVFVNLTFFGARFILTANDVLATSIFSLPQVISGDRMIRMPCDDPANADGKSCFDQIKGSVEKYNTDNSNDPTYSKIAGYADNWLADDKNWFSQTVKSVSLGKRNISLVLLTNMIDLENIVREKSRLGDPSDFAIAAFGSLIVAGAVGIIFFMLFLAMVVRMVVLWVAIAVSPIVALGMVLKELIPGIDLGKGGFDPMKIFISHAFMPTMVAIPLSIGMIMIFANNAVGFSLSFHDIFTFSDSAGNIPAILWWVASLIVIWFGTNKMIQEASPEFAGKVTSGIHNMTNSFVKGAAGTLKYAPIIPGGGQKKDGSEKMVSPYALLRQPSIWKEKLKQKEEGKAQTMAGSGDAIRQLSAMKVASQKETVSPKDREVFLSPESAKLIMSEANGPNEKMARLYLVQASGKDKELNEELTETQKKGGLTRTDLRKFFESNSNIESELKLRLGVSEDEKIMELLAKKAGETSGTSGNNKKESASSKTGIDSGLAGQNVGKDKISGAKNTGTKVGDKEIWQAEIDGKLTYYMPNESTKPEEGGTIMATKDDLPEAIKKIGNVDSDEVAQKIIKHLPKGSVKVEDIKRELVSRIRSGLVKVNELDEYEKIFKEKLGMAVGDFEKLVKEKFEKDSFGWKEK